MSPSRDEALAASRSLPPEKRLALAYDMLFRARRLRDDVRDDLHRERFGADDIQMEMYNQIANSTAFLFPEDEQSLIKMPDAIIQSFGTVLPVNSMANYLPARRLEARLSLLIDLLEMRLGETTRYEPVQAARGVLEGTSDPEVLEIRKALAKLLRNRASEVDFDERDFGFISHPDLRTVLQRDYLEAQQCFAAEAFKASAVLSAGVVEGMLVDNLRSPEITSHSGFEAATANFPHVQGAINWDRVNLSELTRAAAAVGTIGPPAQRLIDGARDFRNSVHPLAEIRDGIRAQREEAELILAFIRLTYRDISIPSSRNADD